MKQDSPLWHAKHVVRAFLLLIIAVVALVLLRTLLVPDSWGQFGWYRGDNVAEQRAKEQRHGGNTACMECHDQEYETLAGAGHAAVKCEGCHAAVALHAVDGEWIAEMPIHREAELCLRCHQWLDARPRNFPQIKPREHVDEQGGEYGPAVCFDCHDPHAPL